MRVAVCVVAVLACSAVSTTGCSKSGDAAAHASATPAPALAADAGRGRAIYAANCAACHGETGREGGVGPALAGERAHASDAQTQALIEDPQPPMPKLYPAPLSDKDVSDVAAYVQSL